jgi:hypothetical protein
VATVGDVLSSLNISFLVDDSNNSIGRRYARTDEIGIPFAITVENTLGVSGTVTLRDRDTCGQVCGVMKAQGGFQGGPLLSSGQRWPGQPNSTPPHVSCVRFPFLPPPPSPLHPRLRFPLPPSGSPAPCGPCGCGSAAVRTAPGLRRPDGEVREHARARQP